MDPAWPEGQPGTLKIGLDDAHEITTADKGAGFVKAKVVEPVDA